MIPVQSLVGSYAKCKNYEFEAETTNAEIKGYIISAVHESNLTNIMYEDNMLMNIFQHLSFTQ